MEHWKEGDNKLSASFTFADFAEAFTFMTEVAFQAEKQNHHPVWRNVWNRVDIELSTHDAGNIVTEKDHTLARSIDRVYQRFKS